MGSPCQSFLDCRKYYCAANSCGIPPHRRARRGDGRVLFPCPCYGPFLPAVAGNGSVRRLLCCGLQDDRKARLFSRWRGDDATCIRGNVVWISLVPAESLGTYVQADDARGDREMNIRVATKSYESW